VEALKTKLFVVCNI